MLRILCLDMPDVLIKMVNLFNNLGQSSAGVGEAVLRARWDLGKGLLIQKSVLSQFPESFGEDLG